MIIVKFIVLFGCISVLSALQTYYCEICSNHTLCQYKISGPSAACQSYDNTALLSTQEISELIHKMNEKRNFIALGHSKMLPQAANMKKIHWSTELATMAQRWADQCDPFLHPDREDDCRDLEYVKVGQNIGSVVGPTPGLNVKSFIEMWFIQILDYAGTVTYYNQSRDHNTDYFTQLIWAETEFVGCGKVKFYVYERKVMIERLVCNFAPKGNIHGKSVYAIGYAGTQCAHNMIADDDYKGLCGYEDRTILRKLTTRRPPTSNLLRILNLSNDSVRLEIDPIRNNQKQSNIKRKRQRNQKTRHVLLNNTYDVSKRLPLRQQNIRKSLIQNMSRNLNDDDYHYQHDRGHSRLYHGHEEPARRDSSRPNYPTTNYFEGNNNQDFRRYDYTSAPVYLISSPKYRKFYQNNQCTRQTVQVYNGCCNNHKCTRGRHPCCHQSDGCQSEIFTNPRLPEHLCPCTTLCPTICPTTCSSLLTTVDNCNTRCKCMSNDVSKDEFQSYNNIPNMVRSGNHKAAQGNSSPKEDLDKFYDAKISKSFKTMHETENVDQFHEQLEDEIHPKYSVQDRDYLYRSLDTRPRKRRHPKDDITLKPFWKINGLSYKRTPELKTLKYTTLTNRKNRKTRRNMQSIFHSIATETITIKKKDNSDDDDNDDEHTTEKYLSFDELMYLRKFSNNHMNYNFRRADSKDKSKDKEKDKDKDKGKSKDKDKDKSKDKDKEKDKSKDKEKDKDKDKGKEKDKDKQHKDDIQKDDKHKDDKHKDDKHKDDKHKDDKHKDDKHKDDKHKDDKHKDKPKDKDAETHTKAATTTTTKHTTTTEYTANTPFERKKHCTRKLTCTWTAFTGTAEDGVQLGPVDFGSRTPPGYVDGCTRTSTCTRDFMDRNKMGTASGVSGGEANESIVPEDEEYCEKRSLNVRKRNSDYKYAFSISQNYLTYTVLLNSNKDSVTESLPKITGCHCNKNIRVKREESTTPIDDSKIMSYADLYYLVLNKIINTNKDKPHNTKKCQCNSANNTLNDFIYLFCFVTFNFMIYHNNLM